MSDTVQRYLEALQAPFSLPDNLPTLKDHPRNGPAVIVFSPHPDDECVIGTLPLRLRREAHARVINVAVTLGSNPERRDPRRHELAGACEVLGFEIHELGYQGVTLKTRAEQAETWHGWVQTVAGLMAQHQASVIVFPHANDLHPAHIGTHQLIMDALPLLGPKHRPLLALTEFWHPMTNPNLMVEASTQDLQILLAALAHHKGEIARNPYHLRLPGYMIDNTRRGLELIGGFGEGKETPRFAFSSLYRLIHANGEAITPANIPANEDISQFLRKHLKEA